jgi:flagellar hook-associated protein 1 FlgK
MSSDLLSIARSGAMAARVALDVTAQNIANASSDGYVRRSVRLAELASSGGFGRIGDVSLSGVRLDAVIRNVDGFRQTEVRRTGSDAARAAAELTGLQNIETATEQTNVYPAVTGFETSLERLSADPVSPSLRAAVLEDARTMARSFNIASQSLDSVGEGLRFEAGDGVDQVNLLAGELARVNLRLARASDATSDQSALLDARDNLLQRLSGFANISTTISADDTVEVRLGGSGGPQLVAGGTATSFAMTTAANGTISFTLGAAPAPLSGGSLAGKSQALIALADTRSELDGIADTLIAAANAAQASGVAIDGTAGQPLFSGMGSNGITLALATGAGIATAPAGAGAGSRDPANLNVLRNALSSNDIAGKIDSLLFGISSKVAGRATTSEALSSIAGSARIALEAQSGVDLDAEAVNLMRFQQAFQASGKAMQVAGTLFDTLLAIR